MNSSQGVQGDIQEKAIAAYKFGRFLYDRFMDDDCQNTAASLTYQTLFAVVPFITVVYVVLHAFDAFEDMGGQATDFVFANVLPENVAVIQQYIEEFSTQARGLTVPSAVLLAVTVFLMLFTIERTFNEIWRIKEPRHGFNRLLMYWALLTLCPLLLVAGIATTTYILSLPLISDVSESPFFFKLIPLALSTATCTLLYVAVPNTTVPVRHALIGGFLVSLIFESAKWIFSSVMSSQSSFQVIYGAYAVIPLFLLWIYVSWTILLAGAELVKGLGVYRFDERESPEEPLFQVLIILELFYRAHRAGTVVTDWDIRNESERIDLEHWPEYQQHLMNLNLIRVVDKGGMVLTKDLADMSLWQLHELSPWPLPRDVRAKGGWEKSLSDLFEEIEADNKARLAMNLEAVFAAQREGEVEHAQFGRDRRPAGTSGL